MKSLLRRRRRLRRARKVKRVAKKRRSLYQFGRRRNGPFWRSKLLILFHTQSLKRRRSLPLCLLSELLIKLLTRPILISTSQCQLELLLSL